MSSSHYKSRKLDNVCYEIRGPVLEQAYHMEEEGHRITKLNIGNPAPFGLDAPEEIIQDVIRLLPTSQGYSDARGLFAGRKAVMQECQRIGIPNVEIDDIYLGNGVSELISIATQALINNGDEILIPAPDYPLWTAATTLAGGVPVHYRCDESEGWQPDLDDIRSRINKRTRAIVVINPNNPTGAVYSEATLRAIIELASEHNLVVFADEIYSKITYDGAKHIPMGSLGGDCLVVTFNGLSKSYRLAGFRSGWLILSGALNRSRDYIEGINLLTNMRMCSNVPAQQAIQTALGGYQSIGDLIIDGGRLAEQRKLGWELLNAIPGVSCHKPEGAIYLFPRLDPDVYPIKDDEQFVLDLLIQEKLLLVQGTGFNWPQPDHLRLTFLPRVDELGNAIGRLAHFLEGKRSKAA